MSKNWTEEFDTLVKEKALTLSGISWAISSEVKHPFTKDYIELFMSLLESKIAEPEKGSDTKHKYWMYGRNSVINELLDQLRHGE